MKSDQASRLRQIYGSPARLRHAATRRQAATQTITITSGKGGVGKTNICLNLGIALARQHKRVLLVDADMNLGNLDVLLGLNPEYTIRNVIAEEMKLQDILVEGPHGVHIAPATSGASELSEVKISDRRALLQSLAEIASVYDFILIDTPAGLGPRVFDFIDVADSAMVVTTPEPTAIIDAYAMLKVIWNRNSQKHVQLMVNFCTSTTEAEEVHQKMSLVTQHYLNRSVEDFCYIVYDENISKSVFEQQAFIEQFPKTNAAICIEKIASDVIKQTPGMARIHTLKEWMKNNARSSQKQRVMT